jgi:hypothetical protein
MNVHASLSADARHQTVWITFKIENRGERRVWLPRTIAADTTLTGRLFDLTLAPAGTAVDYIGPLRGQGAASAADYFELAPHSAHTHTIDITPDYAFAPGTHDYTLRYAVAALADIRHPDATTALVTEPVVFTHSF